jgi:hypothetical protein
MFGLFKADPFDDPALGRLVRKGSHWRGTVSLPGAGEVAAAIIGDRSGPDLECLAAVRDIRSRYAELRPAIEAELAEHRRNGLEGGGAEEDGLDASSIWDKVQALGVLGDRWAGIPGQGAGKVPIVVIEYRVDWDEEHTLGAVIDGETLVELNGSVLSVF